MKGSRNSMSTIPIRFFFLFLFIYNFADILAAPIRHLCRPDQRDALLEFKNEITIGEPSSFCFEDGLKDPYPKTESWTNNSDCCNWEGITCNAKSGKVMEIDLLCSCLHGQFHSNSSLLNLHSLTALNLSRNNFSGQIPSSIGNLSQLSFISLSYNNFSGQIPHSIGKLSHLTLLSFHTNNFVGPIPSSIGNLSHLTTLLVQKNNFVGSVPSWIGNLSQLAILSLSYNQFVGQIPSSFDNLNRLTHLYIESTRLTGNIPSWIENLSHLTELYLADNNFFGQIPSSIGNLSHLTTLTLYSNHFSGQIPSSFGNLNQLTYLHIDYNKLSGKIPVELLNLTQLSYLALSYNELSGSLPINNTFSGTLHSSLFTLPSLTGLYLDNNQLSGTLEFGNISSPPQLQSLHLDHNNFIGPFPSSISKFTNLSTLDLSQFNTQGPTDFSIFSHLKLLTQLSLSEVNTTTTIEFNDILSYFKKLSILNLSGNLVSITNKISVLDPPSQMFERVELSSCGITEIPQFLRSQHHMVYIDISNNKIKGQVPGWLWTLPNLEVIHISNNTFTGFENLMKDGISSSQKSSIKHLLSSNNNFTGGLPSFICDLGSLITLDLSKNNFNGSIPRCMRSLERTLTDLNLRQNRLHGGLPENVFKSLRSLDVGNNQLVGKLPRSLIHSPAHEVLNVESNIINDTFPFWLSSLQKLQVLILRSNAFHGPIHQASFPKLQIIDISQNHFIGTLPSNYFVKWSAMSSLGTNKDQTDEKYMGDFYYHDSMVLVYDGQKLVHIKNIFKALDFSGNKFEGEVPRSIGLLKGLHVLNLSGNNFTGELPSFICAMRSLRTLDLSNNNFNGSIPRCVKNLERTLFVLNLRHNRLHGGLPDNIFKSLRSLDVGHNQLEGKLPRSLIHFSSLEVLNVESNRINDTFPFWLSSLQKLEILVLRSNAFHGAIHQVSLPKLQIIDISHNHFTGNLSSNYFVKWNAMSSSLGTNKDQSDEKYVGGGSGYYEDSMVLVNKGVKMELVRILHIYRALDFSGNKFDGEIPRSIGLLKELHVLNLSGNAFTGHIPSSMGNLTALESLDVSQNHLSGRIPQELGSLSFLSYMNFSHNQLSGLVPWGTQFRTQNCSSFKYNLGLYGPSLDEVCKDIHTPTSEDSDSEEEDEDEEVISWIAVVVGFISGIVFGITLGYSFARRSRKTTTKKRGF